MDEILNLIESVSEGFPSYSPKSARASFLTLAFQSPYTIRMSFVFDAYDVFSMQIKNTMNQVLNTLNHWPQNS